MSQYSKDVDAMMARVAESSMSGPRSDLRLADYRQVDKGAAKLLLQYAIDKGHPSLGDVEAHILGVYQGRLFPVLASVRYYERHACVELVVESIGERRSVDDAKGFIRVAGNVYNDPSGHMWELREAEGGVPFLFRQASEDISDIIERRNMLLGHGMGIPRFSDVEASREAGWVGAREGDVVEFVKDGTLTQGTYKETLPDNRCKVMAGNAEFTLPRQMIVRIVQGSTNHVAAIRQQVEPYLGKLYPNNMVNDIIQRLVNFGVPIKEP